MQFAAMQLCTVDSPFSPGALELPWLAGFWVDVHVLRHLLLSVSPLPSRAVGELVTHCWFRPQNEFLFCLFCNWLSSVPVSATCSLAAYPVIVCNLCFCFRSLLLSDSSLPFPCYLFLSFLFSFVLMDIISKPEEAFSYKQPSDQSAAL